MLQTQFMSQLPTKSKIHGVQYLVRGNIYKDLSQKKLEPLTNNRRHGHFFHYRKVKKKTFTGTLPRDDGKADDDPRHKMSLLFHNLAVISFYFVCLWV